MRGTLETHGAASRDEGGGSAGRARTRAADGDGAVEAGRALEAVCREARLPVADGLPVAGCSHRSGRADPPESREPDALATDGRLAARLGRGSGTGRADRVVRGASVCARLAWNLGRALARQLVGQARKLRASAIVAIERGDAALDPRVGRDRLLRSSTNGRATERCGRPWVCSPDPLPHPGRGDDGSHDRARFPALGRGLEAMYVPSWCRLRGAIRVFAVHRILSIESLPDERARARPTVRALERAFRIWYRDKVEHVEVLFTGRVAGAIRERRWHTSQRTIEAPDGGVYLHLDISAPEELERWLLGFGPDARVVEPVRLAEQIRRLHAQAAGTGVVIEASSPRRVRARPRVANPVVGRARRST
jgi:hypothetical protein